jgi:hypothetical protein
MAYFNSAPIGSLLTGELARKIGSSRMVMHPIYQEMKLLPK